MSKQRNPKGTGSYKKRSDGRYEYKITIDGKTRTLYSKSLTELKEKVKKLSNVVISSNNLTVAEWFDKWLENVVKPLKKQATYEQYKYIYDKHVYPIIGERRITTILKIDIQEVIAKMNKKDLSTQTMKHAKKVMRLGFESARTDKFISDNPVVDIDIPIKQAKQRKTLTPDELKKLFDAMGDSRWIWSVKFDLVTGLRRGELLAIKWGNIDFDGRRLFICESNSNSGVGDTKSSKSRYIPLSDSAIVYLSSQRDMLKSEGLFDCELVFPNNKGTMLKPGSYYTMMSRFAKKAGIYAHPHCIRHTFVYLTRSELPLKDLQAILGHESSTHTLDIYGDIINENNQNKISAIDNAIAQLDEAMSEIQQKEEKAKSKSNIIQLPIERQA